jgi:hypothetical protein
MANDRLIIKTPVLILNPLAAATDISKWCSSLTIQPTKKAVDTSGFADSADKWQKGPGSHSTTWTLMHSKDMSILLAALVTEYNLDASTPVSTKWINATNDPTNPLYSYSVLVDTVPMGGQRGNVAQLQLSYKIDGTIDQYDGTTHTTI